VGQPPRLSSERNERARKAVEKALMKGTGRRRFLILLLLVSAVPRSPGQQPSSAEKQAAEKVAEEVHRARAEAKLTKLVRIEDPRVRENACARAKTEATSWQMGCGAFARDGVIDCFSYSTSDPARVEPELVTWAKHESRDPRRFAVGVCTAPAPDNRGEKYWIEVNSYMGATKSFFWRTGYALSHLWSR